MRRYAAPNAKQKMIIFGCDHNALKQKDALKEIIAQLGVVVVVSETEIESKSYIDIASDLCRRVIEFSTIGVIICGTGIGVSIVANKHKGILAARCVTIEDAHDSRYINNANVLCLSAKCAPQTNGEIIKEFVRTQFDTTEQRIGRFEKIKELEGSVSSK